MLKPALIINRRFLKMKKIVLSGALILGILGTAAANSNLTEQAGYPTQHSISQVEYQGGYQTLGYPTQH